ncbi:MAG TPA: PspA/IM30 family protein [Acidimicrobiales bacterium]|nr:PspA/IM30 family protein [Acidimicrobiales bacterium]
MAGVFKRMSAILQAKTNKVLDKAEDPRETLDLSYEKQLDSLQKVRRSVADVATARKRIELQAAQLQKQADKLQQQAKAALAAGNEDLAREALSRRAALGEQLSDLKTQHDQVVEQEERLVETSQRLQAQVEQFRTRKETLKASYTAAEAQTKVGEAVSGISTSMGDAGQAMQRAQDKIAGMQARAGAIDELLASGALSDLNQPVDDIQAQLNKLSGGTQVDSELAALRAELAATSPAGELGASEEEPATDAQVVDATPAPPAPVAAPPAPAPAPAAEAAPPGPSAQPSPAPAPGGMSASEGIEGGTTA